MTLPRRSDIAAVIVVLSIIGGIVSIYATTSVPAPVSASSRLRDRAMTSEPDPHPTALFIGDSYTAGKGSAELSYGCEAALRMGWLCKLAAIGGTGYISGGPANRWVVDQYTGATTSFIERIGRLANQYRPNIVVLDGGRNDELAPPGIVLQAMIATIAEVHRIWPAAKIVVLRPRFLANPSANLGYDDALMQRLAAQPDAAGVVFLDPIGLLAGTDTSNLVDPDRIHPNRLGEARLTEALVNTLVAHVGAMT